MRQRTFSIFRYDPKAGKKAGFQQYELDVEDEKLTTVLDCLFRIQEGQDHTLAFRYACRVGMCGSCAMVINGRERLACKTVIGDLPADIITVRPLNHFPIIKDLVVDLSKLFTQYKFAMGYFEPKGKDLEPAIIRPDSEERKIIGLETECIACGACVSSCTMMYWDPDYIGPAALTRAFTLLADSREAHLKERLMKLVNESGCYRCHTEFNCTEVCPKELSPTRAIQHVKMLALKHGIVAPKEEMEEKGERMEVAAPSDLTPEQIREISRRDFLTKSSVGLAGAVVVALAGISGLSSLGISSRPKQWVRVGDIDDFPPGRPQNKIVTFDVVDGYFKSRVQKPIIVSRQAGADDLVVFNTSCTHLGCNVRWDENRKLLLCACHGGAFYPDGKVKSGPPPSPLERYQVKVKERDIFVLVS